MAGLLLTACAGSPPPRPATTRWPSEPATCRALLAALNVRFTPWAGAPASGSCAVPAPVEVSRTSADLAPVLRTSCPMLLAWARFEPEMQRLAEQRLGSRITEIRHYGSYSCRKMTGNQRRMSLHSTGEALDIAGFTTADGRHISVLDDWPRRSGGASLFLNDLAQAACRHFNVVLTPNHDRAHRDHIHVDIGPWKLCKA